MNTPADYISWVRMLIALSPVVVGHSVLRETVEETVAVYRYRLRLLDGSLLEASERIVLRGTEIVVSKYSFHWQDQAGRLIARWDTAPHHLELPTFPHHIHDGAEENIQPHAAVSAWRMCWRWFHADFGKRDDARILHPSPHRRSPHPRRLAGGQLWQRHR